MAWLMSRPTNSDGPKQPLRACVLKSSGVAMAQQQHHKACVGRRMY